MRKENIDYINSRIFPITPEDIYDIPVTPSTVLGFVVALGCSIYPVPNGYAIYDSRDGEMYIEVPDLEPKTLTASKELLYWATKKELLCWVI